MTKANDVVCSQSLDRSAIQAERYVVVPGLPRALSVNDDASRCRLRNTRMKRLPSVFPTRPLACDSRMSINSGMLSFRLLT